MDFDVQRWRECWHNYEEWADKNDTRDRRDFGAILKDIDWLYAHFPPEVRSADPDPEKLGIQDYYRALAAHDRLRNRS